MPLRVRAGGGVQTTLKIEAATVADGRAVNPLLSRESLAYWTLGGVNARGPPSGERED